MQGGQCRCSFLDTRELHQVGPARCAGALGQGPEFQDLAVGSEPEPGGMAGLGMTWTSWQKHAETVQKFGKLNAKLGTELILRDFDSTNAMNSNEVLGISRAKQIEV